MGPFVGRAAELATLGEIAGAAVGGEVAAAVVVGDPGSGKSRLLAEVAAGAKAPSFLPVVGYEPERHVPLASAANLLKALCESGAEGRRLEAMVFDTAPGEASALEPMRVFEAVHRALRAYGPAFVTVDDLQWVDELSLALFHYLLRGAETSGPPLALIAVARPSPSSTSFVSSLAQVLPAGRFVSLELGPLGSDEAYVLVRTLAPELSERDAHEVAARSSGSPFWLEALVQTAGAEVDTGRLVTARLRGASADAAGLLALLAVAGRPLSIGDAADLEGWEAGRAEQAVTELVARGIAIEAGGSIRPAHDLIRAAAMREIPEERRVAVQRRVGEWLAGIAGDDIRRLREALGHFHEAGLPSLELAERLVRSPHRVLLGVDGLRLLGSIVDATDPFGADAQALAPEVAALATELAEHEEALSRWSQVAERAETRSARATALLAASKAAFALDRVGEAQTLLTRSREASGADDVLRLEQDTHDAAIELWVDWRTTEGRSLARAAVSAAKQLAARAGGVDALDPRRRRAYIDAVRLEYEAAVQEADTETMRRSAAAREEAARGFDLESHLEALLTSCLVLPGPEAAERARTVLTEAQRHVFPRLAVAAGEMRARILQELGELIEAEHVVDETLELVARAGDVPRARHRVARVASTTAIELREPWAALEQIERATEREPNDHQRIDLHGDVALWNARLRGSAAARTIEEHVAEGRRDADRVGCPRCEAELLLLSAEAFARIGERAKARELLAAWDRQHVREHELGALSRRHTGALAAEDPARRVAELEAVRDAANASPYRLQALWVQLDLGLALAEAGSEHAKAELERAASLAAEIGAGTAEAMAVRGLRALGVRTWRRRPGAGALTEREAEIARLVASGASNPEIAQTLFLSRKTVERHVSNLLRKVGVRNRAELAARVSELESEGAHR